jgi:hypothetical protein
LAKKALKLALEQHPKSSGLKLVASWNVSIWRQTELAEKLLNELYAIEPTNEEIYIQKQTSALKETNTKKQLNY